MKNYLKLLLLSIIVLVLAACTDDSNVEPGGDTGGEEASSGGGDMVLSFPSDAVSMDPHGSNDVPSEQVRDTMYEGLVTQDENLEVVPLLATEWEQTDDTTWLFTLREDVTFHDGSEFNADVVKKNLDRLLDTAAASERAFVLEMIEEVNVVDDYQVEIVTEFPFAPIINHLTHGAGKMMSGDLIDEDYQNAIDEAGLDMTAEEYYELRAEGGAEYEEVSGSISEFIGTVVEQNPIGSNYMQFENRNPGESTELVAYEDYWDGAPTIDSATFKVVSETGSRIAELETGSSDFIAQVESSNIERMENNEDVTLERTDSVSIDYIGFNTEKEPLNDPQVRLAITHAFDKNAVLAGVYNDSGTPAVGPLAPGILGHSDDLQGPEYNMDRARELLAEAGYEDGFDVNLMVNDDNPERVDMAVWLQESLAELNINVNIEQVEWGAYLEMTGNGEHDMFILGWSNSTGDPDNGISPLFHSSMVGAEGNRSFYQNEELDALLDEGKRESDPEAREEIYQQAQQILVDDAPAIFVRHSENLNAYSNNVENIGINRYNIYDLRDVTISE
ncbi:glutathione ABC transporter substrate-binding protein [Salinicoccus sp. ID82-1]|uniref:Glutathione ABC transporter substrate-binding protein n=1 Tax=Salinicoccus cyprini TaxID=2493691 RepID=A0A558AR20_9STAP|nr:MULTISPECIES: glutathione ABC transporter substrate-binding protein [Salinicoccus]MCG1010239.1 glutathione ABC transporter substrate-binding protein [Salinicoccus sp. ID82-1]TVT26707.1 glutathione ABC transporter substrate-binding protein [Salinicoccus cyprini]